MGFCESFAKVILVVLNVIFFILGAALLGLGIWLKVDKSYLFQMMRNIKLDATADSFGSTNASALSILAILLIIIGTFTFITGFCGCCGAINESQCLLYTYAFLVSVVVIIEISVGIYAAVENSKFETKIKSSLTKVLEKNFNGLSAKTPNAFTMLLSAIMIEGNCCGINNISDFNSIRQNWTHDINNVKQVNPIACCKFKSGFKFNPEKDVTVSTLQNSLVDSSCPTNSGTKEINTEGCINSFVTSVKGNIKTVIGVCIGIGLFEILCIVFACCVARKD